MKSRETAKRQILFQYFPQGLDKMTVKKRKAIQEAGDVETSFKKPMTIIDEEAVKMLKQEFHSLIKSDDSLNIESLCKITESNVSLQSLVHSRLRINAVFLSLGIKDWFRSKSRVV